MTIIADRAAHGELKLRLTKAKAKPYALVTNMDFAKAVPMSLADLGTYLHGQEFMHRDHVKFFVNFANTGKIARRKPNGTLDSNDGKMSWTAAAGLPPLSSDGYFISVRRTGAPSIVRIGEGHPTKPHAILDKSLAPKRAKDIADQFKYLKAYVEHSKKNSWRMRLRASKEHMDVLSGLPNGPNLPANLKKAVMEDDGVPLASLIPDLEQTLAGKLAPESPFIGFVGWWVTVELRDGGGPWIKMKAGEDTKDQMSIPVGFLKLGSLKVSKTGGRVAEHPKGHPVGFLDHAGIDAYTGDYDLHDVYLGTSAGGANRRAFVSSPATDVVTGHSTGPREGLRPSTTRLPDCSTGRPIAAEAEIRRPSSTAMPTWCSTAPRTPTSPSSKICCSARTRRKRRW